MRISIKKKIDYAVLNVGFVIKHLRIIFTIFLFVLFFFSSDLLAQTSVQNFGTGATSLTSTTGNTTTIPNPTSGTTWARGGATAPAAPINILNNTNPLGSTGSYVNAVASSSGVVSKFSPWVSYTGGTEFYTSFKVKFGDASGGASATTGSWTYYQGAGAMYSDANDFTGTQVFTGLRFTYGASGAISMSYRGGGSWINTSLTTTSLSSSVTYTIEIVGNNKTSGTINYSYNGIAQTVAVQKFDLFLNGSLIGDELAEAQLPSNSNINSGTFIGISSTSNVANVFADDFNVYNAVPVSIGFNGITSAQSGNWTSTSTWVGGVVPSSTDNVVIANGHTVTVDGAVTRNVGTITTVTGILATNVTYTNNGTTNVNGAFQLNQGGWATGSNFVYGSNGTLVFNNSSGLYGVNSGDIFWPTSNGPFNVTVQNTGGMQLNAARTVAGLFQTAAQVALNAVSLTINGTNQLNTGGYFSNSPTYGSTATLVYNASSTYGVSNEWTGNSTTPGIGIPKNVTVQNAGLNLPTSSRGIGGNMTISAGTLSLSSTSGSDLYVGGNWTRAAAATFTPSSRAVFFNGSATQVVTVTGGGTETFNYLISSGSGTIQLATGTNLSVNTSNGLTLSSSNGTSSIDLNGQSLTLSGGNISLSSGNRFITSTIAGGVFNITTAATSVTSGGLLTIGTNVSTTLSTSMSFGSNLTTIQGVLQINTGGSVTASSAPVYASTSTLIYNGVSNYGVNNEWTGNATTAGSGTPQNVTLTSSTINMPASTLSLAGNITIGSSSVLNLNATIGADLNISGNWINQGTFNPNQRLVLFRGTAAETLTGSTIFDYLTLNNTAGLTLQASSDITITNTLNLQSGVLTTATNKVIVSTAAGTVTRTSGWVNGNLQRYFVAGSVYTKTFDIGNTTNWLPVTISANADTSGGILVATINGDIPSIGASPILSTKSVNRYWTITKAGIAVTAPYDLIVNYISTEPDALLTLANTHAAVDDGSSWNVFTSVSATTTTATVTGVTVFGNVILGEDKPLAYYRTIQPGDWGTNATWQVSSDNVTWTAAASGDIPNSTNANVIIQNGHIINRSANVQYTVNNITVNAGGVLKTNVVNNNYFNLYGNIVCNGTIGDATDNISFNIEGSRDTIKGSGTFYCKRMRKLLTNNIQTNVVVEMNVNLTWNSSASFYNGVGASSSLNLFVSASRQFNCSSISIDGTKGTTSGNSGGTYTINGTLNADTIYMTTNNGSAPTYNCRFTVGSTGVINTKSIYSTASGLGKHYFTINNGGSLNLIGSDGFRNFSSTNNVFDFQPGSTVDYSATANQTIESGIPYYDNLILSGSGNKTANGDLNIRGNWTRTSPAAFLPNIKAVLFNGTSGNQTINVTGGGIETFAYLIISKPAAQSLQLSSSPASNISIIGGNGGNAFQLQNGNFDLNGRTCTFSIYNGNANNIGIDGSAGNLTRNITSTIPGGVFSLFNYDLSNGRFSTIQRLSANAALLNFAIGDTLTIGGTSANSGVNFGTGLTTINGNFQINTWGYVEANGPAYGTNSNLIYNAGGTYKRFKEWESLSGAGYPYNVIVQNNTSLRINEDSVNVFAPPYGNGAADRGLAGSLTIQPGATAILGDSTENKKLSIGLDFNLNGNMTLPSTTVAIGADLYIGGNWYRSATGVFNHNERAVFFNGATNSTITASGGQYFPYLYLQKTASTNTLSLLDNITIGKIFTIISGTFDPATKDATLLSRDTTAQFGPVGTNGRVTYSGNGRFIVERSASSRRAWRLLSSPTRHDFQTIKQSWQENATVPNSNPVPGYGIQITSNRTSWQADGFDTLSIAGPSMKCYNPSTNLYDGITSTNSNFVIGKAYMTFIRGDRSVTQFTQSPTTTILREKGSLIIGDTAFLIGTADSQYVSVGNPYASSIDFTKLTRNNVQTFYYLWDPKLSNYGAFQTCLISGNTIIAAPGAGSYTSGNYNIQSGQGFFVRNTTGIGSLTFKELDKVEGSFQFNRAPDNFGSIRTNLYKIQNGNPDLFDGVINIFDSSYSSGLDMMDATKFNNTNENLSIKKSDKYFAIESRPGLSQTDTIQYRLGQMRATSYRFEIIPQRLSVYNVEAFLVDSYLNSRLPISLTDTTYVDFNISNDVGSYNPERFSVVFNSLRPLPVTMTTLSAIRIKADVQLSWNAENESGIRTYQVESSTDGRQFHVIGQELPLVNNGGSATYNYRHVNAPSAVIYYRVAAVNIDGSIQYTNIAKVNALKEKPSIAVNPNPVSGNTISIDLLNMEKGSYSAILYTMEGKKLAATSFLITNSSENKKLRLGKEIPSGKYNLVVISSDLQRYSIPVQIIQ